MLTRAHIDPLLEADSSGPVSITTYILLELNLQTRLGPIGGHLATFVPQYRGEFRHGQSRVGTDLSLEWAAAVLKRRRPVSGEQRDRDIAHGLLPAAPTKNRRTTAAVVGWERGPCVSYCVNSCERLRFQPLAHQMRLEVRHILIKETAMRH